MFQLGANYAYGVDVQAEHVAYTVSELAKRDAKVANVSAEAEQNWVDDQLEREFNPSQLILGGSPETCTPGYYNQEGTAKRYRDVRLESYSKGLGAYRKVLNAWRLQDDLEGLELS